MKAEIKATDIKDIEIVITTTGETIAIPVTSKDVQSICNNVDLSLVDLYTEK